MYDLASFVWRAVKIAYFCFCKHVSVLFEARNVAFCDVDLNRTLNVKKLQPDAPIYQNFQEMLAAEGDKIDAVTVSTPDHMHAFCSIAAMRAGKGTSDAYMEDWKRVREQCSDDLQAEAEKAAIEEAAIEKVKQAQNNE